MSSGRFILGVLFGAAAGVVTGILIAPEKGAATREKISEMGEEYLDGVRDKFDEMLENMSARCEQMKKDAQKLVEKK